MIRVRIGLYDDIEESTRSGAVDAACEFTQQIVPALERAVDHPDVIEDLVEVLSTP